MKNQKGFTVVELVIVVFLLCISIGWVKNIIKLAQCDFEAPYKAEVIHTVGVVVPPVGMVVGWMDLGR